MTKKLYYDDAYQTCFISKVIKKSLDESGRYFVVLKETAFYPTGGGQPHDTGTINRINIVDVEEINGEIRHYLENECEEEDVSGEINWDRRFDHMQQHAGQHLLTAVFEDKIGYKTLGFHLGKDTCTIDLDAASLSDEEIATAEREVNKLIIENKPIETKWVNKGEELAKFSLRKELSVTENIRLVIVPEIDYNGCGGTHPNSTAEIGSIKILHTEKQKKLTRVHFVCGHRVIDQLHEKQKIIQELTKRLSAPQSQMIEAVDRLLQNTKELEDKASLLSNQLIGYETKELMTKAEDMNGYSVIRASFKDRSINDIQLIAKELVLQSNTLAFLISEYQGKVQIVMARSEDIDLNLNHPLKSILPFINGKGGGKPSFVQGGGENLVTPEELFYQLGRSLRIE